MKKIILGISTALLLAGGVMSCNMSNKCACKDCTCTTCECTSEKCACDENCKDKCCVDKHAS